MKIQCENCPARNSRVRRVKFAGRRMFLCEECRAAAGRVESTALAAPRSAAPPVRAALAGPIAGHAGAASGGFVALGARGWVGRVKRRLGVCLGWIRGLGGRRSAWLPRGAERKVKEAKG